ncbi:MAG TPA: hypothetical protein VIF36_02730 [Gaiellaceae bacterium]|jgi:hypothetical protein
MRRFLVPLLLLVAAFPAVALSDSGAARPDGTLAVRDGRGKVVLEVKGSVIGRFGNGTLNIQTLEPTAASDPVVRGHEKFKWGRGAAPTYIYSGKNVRFRLIGGRYRVTFTGKGLFFSLVGKGRVQLDGNGSVGDGIFYDGFYSLNGGEDESLPDEPVWLPLAPTPPPPPPPPSARQPAG